MTANAATSPVLVAEGLVKRYGGLVANNGVGMRLGPGEMRGLIGPNGAGKTTFVNLVTGIEAPDAGTVKLGDRDITGQEPHRIAGAGLVRSFQMARIFANLTTTENLMIPWFASGTKSRSSKFLSLRNWL
jgi:ABC-type branched-subunit amino acid transport system ATPase component